MQRKGQAAMEFLMTYGWAILAAIIAIGVLAYFGVFSPGKFTPSATVVNPPFYANAWNMDKSTNNVSIELKNNGGETLTISSVAIAVTDGAASCISDTTFAALGLAPSGTEVAELDCSAVPGLDAAGQPFKGDVTITYTKAGSTLSLTSTGTIAGTIAP